MPPPLVLQAAAGPGVSHRSGSGSALLVVWPVLVERYTPQTAVSVTTCARHHNPGAFFCFIKGNHSSWADPYSIRDPNPYSLITLDSLQKLPGRPLKSSRILQKIQKTHYNNTTSTSVHTLQVFYIK